MKQELKQETKYPIGSRIRYTDLKFVLCLTENLSSMQTLYNEAPEMYYRGIVPVLPEQ